MSTTKVKETQEAAYGEPIRWPTDRCTGRVSRARQGTGAKCMTASRTDSNILNMPILIE